MTVIAGGECMWCECAVGFGGGLTSTLCCWVMDDDWLEAKMHGHVEVVVVVGEMCIEFGCDVQTSGETGKEKNHLDMTLPKRWSLMWC
jgi:hypothetical protein